MAFSPLSTLKKQYKGNGKTGPFVYDQFFLSTSEFSIIKTVAGVDTMLSSPADYTITAVKATNGTGYASAKILLTTALESEEILTVVQSVVFKQDINFVNGDIFALNTFEAGLDRIGLLNTQLHTEFQVSLNSPETSTVQNLTLTNLLTGGFLRVNAAGTNLESVNVVDLNLGSSLTPTLNNFIVGDGTAFQTKTPANSRTALGLGTIATQAASAVTITGGSVTGITPLAVTDGGTGGSTVVDAQTNLGVLPGTNVQVYSSELAALASYNTNGILVRSGAGTFVGRSFAASTGLTMTNGSGVSGNPTITYNIPALTEETSPLITDTLLIRKNAGTYMKTQIQNLPNYNAPGAPAGSTFVTLASSGQLTAERVLTGANGVLITDGGANSTVTASVDISGRTTDASPDVNADYAMTYDASATTNKKVLLSSILGFNRTFTLIQSQSFTGVSTVAFTTGINSTYKTYIFTLSNFTDTGTSGLFGVRGSSDGGATYVELIRNNLINSDSGNTTITNANLASSGEFYITPNISETYTGGEAVFYLFNPSSTAGFQTIMAEYALRKSNGTAATYAGYGGGCFVTTVAAINAIRFSMRTTSAGRITLYGVN